MSALAKLDAYIAYAGDPRLVRDVEGRVLDPIERRLCLYASALVQQRGLVPFEASHIDARFQPPATVVFILADASQAEVCRLTLKWLA